MSHLHILEPYTNLYRVWKDEQLERQLRNLIEVFITRILDPQTGHLNLFFEEDWTNKYRIYSYGHDIEASWLIHEAALVLGDPEVLKRIEPIIIRIAQAADEGLNPDGSMIYENFLDKQKIDRELHWWVQAENVVGLPDGTVNRRDDKAGFWKCPYHNGRMCMEVIERFK